MFYEGLYLFQKTGVNTARTLYVPYVSGGQTPWLNGRPADIDSISDQWSKFRNIAIFLKKFRKGLNQNIDQKAAIWSKPSKDRNFLQKK